MKGEAQVLKAIPRPNAGPHGETLVDLTLKQGAHKKFTIRVSLPAGVTLRRVKWVIYDFDKRLVEWPPDTADAQQSA